MIKSLKISIIFVLILWIVRFIDIFLPADLNQYGILPRSPEGLTGILFSPFLHENFAHLISNTVPIFVLLTVIIFFYNKIASWIFAIVLLLGGFLVWCFAREAMHIGASGLVYGFAAFLIANGFFRRNIKSVSIAAIIVFLYSGMIYGILPIHSWMSWEGHLFGAAAGIISAYVFRKNREYESISD